MYKKILALMIIFLCIFPVYGDDYSDRIPEDYTKDEFPQFLGKLRRAEVIFVGSYPFSILFTKIGMSFTDYALSGFNRASAPSLLGGSSSQPPDSSETKKILITSLYVSALITAADYIISVISEKQANEN